MNFFVDHFQRNREELVDSYTVKTYIDNIFKNSLEESLAEIHKQQQNILRNRKKIHKTGSSMDKIWEDSDLFSANGCAYALALMLLKKLDQ